MKSSPEKIEKQHPKKNRQRGTNKRIGFSQEVVTKDVAKTLLTTGNGTANSTKDAFLAKLSDTQHVKEKMKKKKDKNKPSTNGESAQSIDDETISKKKRKQSKNEEKNTQGEESKPKKPKNNEANNTENEEDTNEESTSSTQKSSTEISKRAMKKTKHQKLIEDKKVKVDVVLQQKALNYLSKWKHDNANWKFEKLRQIWLQQNLYDLTKIDDKFWDTTVEYFSSSQGKVRKAILDAALKIVENEQELLDESGEIKLRRARDIVQNLQE